MPKWGEIATSGHTGFCFIFPGLRLSPSWLWKGWRSCQETGGGRKPGWRHKNLSEDDVMRIFFQWWRHKNLSNDDDIQLPSITSHKTVVENSVQWRHEKKLDFTWSIFNLDLIYLIKQYKDLIILYGHLSLKMQNAKFDITVPPCQFLYVKNLTSKITMRLYSSVQMSIWR